MPEPCSLGYWLLWATGHFLSSKVYQISSFSAHPLCPAQAPWYTYRQSHFLVPKSPAHTLLPLVSLGPLVMYTALTESHQALGCMQGVSSESSCV